MANELEGRAAIVTGAGGGIGHATALALASRGAAVVVNDIGRDDEGRPSAASTVDEITRAGGRAIANTESVTEFEGTGRMVARALSEFGRLDILVNNAGVAYSGPSWEVDPDRFDRVVATHVQGTFNCTRHALGPMREQGFGRIVNLVSRAGITGMPNVLPYAAGKGGVFGMTNALARDVAGSGVTVNAVNPSSTGTQMVTGAIDRLSEMGEAGRKRAESLRAQMQSPDHVAVAIASLCLPEAGDINGQFFLVEHDRVGLFQPLTVSQSVERSGGWEADDLCRALGELDLYGLEDAYS